MSLSKRLERFSLPLLVKELLEQSARRRTFVVRIAYSGLLFLFCMLFLFGRMSSLGTGPLDRLGIGRLIYQDLVGLQFAGIYLFLPAIASGAFAHEKEQNTLGLLFLTRLGPWTIVWEKLLSRLIPMACLLLCSLPLIAFSYSLGGLETGSLFTGVWLLTVTMWLISTITIACSAYSHNTTMALLLSYCVIGVVTFGIPAVDYILLGESLTHFANSLDQASNAAGFGSGIYSNVLLFPCAPFIHFQLLIQGQQLWGEWTAFYAGLPCLAMGFLSLLFARFFVLRRAFVTPGNLMLGGLRRIDGLFQRLNRVAGRGILVFQEDKSTPDLSPIAWRETHKRALGQYRYLLRVLLLLTIPAILVSVLIIIRESITVPPYQSSISIVVPILWLASTLLIAITSAGLVSGERSRQTIDVLLAAPLQGRQIILEKMAGIRRMIWILSIPLLGCILLEAYWRESLQFVMARYNSPGSFHGKFFWLEYLVAALSMLWIYPRLTAWLALWIGLKTKSAARASLVTIIAFVALCIGPVLVFVSMIEVLIRPGYEWTRESGIMMLIQFSPLGLLLQSEFDNLREFSRVPYLPIFANCVWYIAIWILIEQHVLRSADQLLGRSAIRK